MPEICAKYTEYTQMEVSPRQPYAGALVFAAFSGSHQDAIAKGMQWRKEHREPHWNVPYLPIDPQDVGREYQTDVIRINSQSGKGGVGYILQENYGLNLPAKFKEAMGYAAKGVSDRTHKELKPAEVYDVFVSTFLKNRGVFDIPECHFRQNKEGITATVTVQETGKAPAEVVADGNGRLDAVTNALKKYFNTELRSPHTNSTPSAKNPIPPRSPLSVWNRAGNFTGAREWTTISSSPPYVRSCPRSTTFWHNPAFH